MKKVVLAQPGVVRIDDVEPETVSPGQAIVQLRVAGICGSDLSAYRGTSPMVTYPRVLGHELLVDVLDCPDRPELEGRRAVVDPMFPCHHCRACLAGRYNCCVNLRVMGVHVDGGLQDVRSIDAAHLVRVPDEMTDEVAVFAEPLTIAYHAVQRSGIEAGQTGVIFGAGPIGLLIAALLLCARGCRALVVDVDAGRLRRAELLGATPLQGTHEMLAQTVEDLTGGTMADVVFEASGSASAMRTTTSLVGHAGRIVMVGWSGPVEIDTVALMRKEVDLLGSRNSVNAFPAVLQLLADGVIDARPLITHRFGLEETGGALELLAKGQGTTLKVLIESS